MKPKKMSRSERERWVFDFANSQIDQIAENDRNRTIEEVWEFGHRKRSQPLREGGTITRLSSGGIASCTWGDVLECHHEAKKAIEGIIKNQTTPTWTVSLKLHVESFGELVQETAHVIAAFLIELGHVLARLAPKLASCPAPAPIPSKLRHRSRTQVPHGVCGKLFLRQRKDKTYCSYRCRLRVAMQHRRLD